MVQIIICVLTCVGTFCIFAEIIGVPTAKANAVMVRLSKKQKKQKVIDTAFENLANFLAKFIRLNEFKRKRLFMDLHTARINVSPEYYVSIAIANAMVVGLLAIPMLYIFPLAAVIIIALAVMLYSKNMKRVINQLKEKREAIESELPRFVSYISNTIKHTRDVLAVMENYRNSAPPEMKDELNITIADMKSGNYEAALIRLESRVGSSMLSEVVRGIIGVIRGDDTAFYWSNMAMRFVESGKQRLKQDAVKRPFKVRKLSMIILVMMVITYAVVLCTEIVNSLGIVFS